MRDEGNSNPTPPQVSVVIPCYNMEALVARTIQCVLDQTSIRSQVIVVDDGSTDGSLGVVRGFGDRIEVLTGPNRGAAAARNAGLALVKAPYVMFLDADDLHFGEVLHGLCEAADAAGADMAFCPARTLDANGLTTPLPSPEPAPPARLLSSWLAGNFAPTCAVMWSTDFLRSIGGWRPEVTRNDDGEVLYRAALAGVKAVRSTRGEAIYWLHRSASRITGNLSAASLLGGHDTVMEVARQLPRKFPGDDALWHSASWASFEYEKLAARAGLTEAVHSIRKARRELGMPRLHGTFMQRLAMRTLGLGPSQRLGHLSKRALRFARRRLSL